ncbi:MAG: FecR family protein [Phycisphaerales bacterium]|nr:FecR family protein [Phycisphaerales bacterium]
MRNRSRKVISASIIALFATAAAAQDHGPQAGSLPPIDQVEVAQLHLAALAAATATGPVEVITAGSTKILEAVILEVRGRCQWREHEESRWQKAATDHRLKPGAMIRTGLKSHMALRCGPNATILVDSNSRVTVPALAQNGDTLSTIVQVERGRADFKVDRVGLTNDFSVVTPSGALSVRGTGMGVSYDGFNGASIFGARFNSINAIEMRYYGNKKIWSVSGGGSTSTKAKNPTMKAVAKAVGGRKPLNKSNAMDAKASASKGGPPQNGVGGGIRETTRLVLGAEQGLRASERREEFEKPRRLEIEAEQLAALQEPEIPFTPPAEPPPANDEPPPPPPEQPPPPQDDPPVPPVDPPAVPIIEIDGYRQYFQQVVSPTDRGMLAAVIYLDLVPENLGTQFPEFSELQQIDRVYLDDDAVWYRHQIPDSFEPALIPLAVSGNNLGLRENPGIGLPYPGGAGPDVPMVNVYDLYSNIYYYGANRYTQWLNDTGPGPMDHDLDVMLGKVDQFAMLPAFQGNQVQVRAAFANAVQQSLYNQAYKGDKPVGTPTFTPYGNSLMSNWLPSSVVPPGP